MDKEQNRLEASMIQKLRADLLEVKQTLNKMEPFARACFLMANIKIIQLWEIMVKSYDEKVNKDIGWDKASGHFWKPENQNEPTNPRLPVLKNPPPAPAKN